MGATGDGGDEVGVFPTKNGEGAVAGGVIGEEGAGNVVGDGDGAGEDCFGLCVGEGAGDCAVMEATNIAAIITSKAELERAITLERENQLRERYATDLERATINLERENPQIQA